MHLHDVLHNGKSRSAREDTEQLPLPILTIARSAPSVSNMQPCRIYLAAGKVGDELAHAITNARQTTDSHRAERIVACGMSAGQADAGAIGYAVKMPGVPVNQFATPTGFLTTAPKSACAPQLHADGRKAHERDFLISSCPRITMALRAQTLEWQRS